MEEAGRGGREIRGRMEEGLPLTLTHTQRHTLPYASLYCTLQTVHFLLQIEGEDPPPAKILRAR